MDSHQKAASERIVDVQKIVQRKVDVQKIVQKIEILARL
jgi:hypothetical protein